MPFSACVRCDNCDGFPCLVHAKSDAEVLGVRPAIEHPNVDAADRRRGGAARDQRRTAPRSPGWWSTTTATRETFTGDLVVVSCGAANSAPAAAGVGDRQAPERAGQRLRPGRAQLHVPQQPGGAGALEGREPDDVPEDARGQRLLLQRTRTSSSRWGTSRWSASRRRRCSAARSRARRARARAGRCEDVARHAVDFWLSTEDLPRPENRVTLDQRRQHPDRLHASNEEPKERLYNQLKSMLGRPRHAPRPPAPAPRLPQERDPGRGLRAPGRAPCRFGTDPARRCSTPTARRTSSTTSTSSTRASSRASAR